MAKWAGQVGSLSLVGRASDLTWGLCVSTLNRIEALETSVQYALGQTHPPIEIVIVDASDAFAAHRERIAALAGTHDVPLRYLAAEKRSLPHQRNQGARAASADILFMIDDDAYMYPDCAEKIMAAYQADTGGLIGAISCTDVPEAPGALPNSALGRSDLASQSPSVRGLMRRSRFARFVWREVLLMSPDRVLVPYDGAREVCRADLVRQVGHKGCEAIRYIPGFALTVRREVLLREPFEDALLAYSPTEDTEASYRFTRHAANARVGDARIYHHHAAAARIKRRQTIELTLANVAFYIRKRSRDMGRDVTKYYLLALRRLLAEALKDGLSRRWTFPQLRGAFAGTLRSITIFRADPATIDEWYQPIQREILSR